MSSTLSVGAASAVEEDAVASVDASVGAGAFRFFAIRFAGPLCYALVAARVTAAEVLRA